MDEALRIFRMEAPEFAAIPDEDVVDEQGNITQYGVKSYLALYANDISCRKFGKRYAKALAYLVAHHMKMNDLGTSTETDGLGSMGLALRIASASEGETSVSFRNGVSGGSGTAYDDYLALSVYGTKFLFLRRSTVLGIVSAAEPIYNTIPGYPHEPDCPNYEG